MPHQPASLLAVLDVYLKFENWLFSYAFQPKKKKRRCDFEVPVACGSLLPPSSPPHSPAVNKPAFKLGRFQAHHFHALSISPPVTGDSGIPGARPTAVRSPLCLSVCNRCLFFPPRGQMESNQSGCGMTGSGARCGGWPSIYQWCQTEGRWKNVPPGQQISLV